MKVRVFMKKVVFLSFFLLLSNLVFSQDCFVSKCCENALQVIKKTNPRVQKIFFDTEISGKWKSYKFTELLRAIDKRELTYNNLFFDSSMDISCQSKLLLCYVTQQRMEKNGVEFINNFEKRSEKLYLCDDFTFTYHSVSATIFSFYPEYISEDKLLLIFSVYITPGLQDSDGNTFYFPANETGSLEYRNPDLYVFVFEKKNGDDFCKKTEVKLKKFQIIYEKARGKKNIYCDNEEEVNKFLGN